MTTKQQTLTADQWQLIFALPADGQPYHLDGIAFRAWHFPQTRMKVEHVIAETQYGKLRRLKGRGGKWQSTEHIA